MTALNVRRTVNRIAAAAVGLAIASSAAAPSATASRAAPSIAAERRRAHIVAAAGDIACPGRPCESQVETARLVAGMNPDAVLPLGDTQYEDGDLRDYARSYDVTWGRFLPVTHPVPGNHEYLTTPARGYFRYFGERAHGPRGFYSYDLGQWHLVALNTKRGATVRPRQLEWLRRDLRQSRHQCELAYFHHARWSSGVHHGSDADMARLWRVLFDHGVDVALTGHEHNYERFAQMGPSGRVVTDGVRSFVVGTGGIDLDGFRNTPHPGSQMRLEEFGVLRLSLRPGEYRWAFHTIAGTVADFGSTQCHG
jgi:hypothetical protein